MCHRRSARRAHTGKRSREAPGERDPGGVVRRSERRRSDDADHWAARVCERQRERSREDALSRAARGLSRTLPESRPRRGSRPEEDSVGARGDLLHEPGGMGREERRPDPAHDPPAERAELADEAGSLAPAAWIVLPDDDRRSPPELANAYVPRPAIHPGSSMVKRNTFCAGRFSVRPCSPERAIENTTPGRCSAYRRSTVPNGTASGPTTAFTPRASTRRRACSSIAANVAPSQPRTSCTGLPADVRRVRETEAPLPRPSTRRTR